MESDAALATDPKGASQGFAEFERPAVLAGPSLSDRCSYGGGEQGPMGGFSQSGMRVSDPEFPTEVIGERGADPETAFPVEALPMALSDPYHGRTEADTGFGPLTEKAGISQRKSRFPQVTVPGMDPDGVKATCPGRDHRSEGLEGKFGEQVAIVAAHADPRTPCSGSVGRIVRIGNEGGVSCGKEDRTPIVTPLSR